MPDVKTLAREALVIIAQRSPNELPTQRLLELYWNAETAGQWRILETLSKRDDCAVERVLELAKSYSGEIGMTILRVAIQPKLSAMTLENLFVNLSSLPAGASGELKKALRDEIIFGRLPGMTIEEILRISLGEDEKVVEAVKRTLHERTKELAVLAE